MLKNGIIRKNGSRIFNKFHSFLFEFSDLWRQLFFSFHTCSYLHVRLSKFVTIENLLQKMWLNFFVSLFNDLFSHLHTILKYPDISLFLQACLDFQLSSSWLQHLPTICVLIFLFQLCKSNIAPKNFCIWKWDLWSPESSQNLRFEQGNPLHFVVHLRYPHPSCFHVIQDAAWWLKILFWHQHFCGRAEE